MKIGLVCHGNIARSQILHHYLVQYAQAAGWKLEVFSCGTASKEAYPEATQLLAQVQRELARRGVEGRVIRHVLDQNAIEQLKTANYILAADRAIRDDLWSVLKRAEDRDKVQLFYEFIGEGTRDFVDTYDPQIQGQDPARFAACFDELERIAGRMVERAKNRADPVRTGAAPGRSGA